MKFKKWEFRRAPYFRRCIIEQFPFIAEDFDAVTTYELLCKVVQYLNNCIKILNEQGQAIDELVKLVLDLESFVNNFFDNLDVQEEINNKLDDMAKSGILSDYLARFAQFDLLKNGIDNGSPEIDGQLTTVSVINDFVDGVIPFYELKIWKSYKDCAIFEPDSSAVYDQVINDGDMRRLSRSCMTYQYNNEDTFILCNGGLPGWYLFPDGKKVNSESNPAEGRGWFYLVKRKDTGALDWLEVGDDKSGDQLNPDLHEWGFPIWSPVRVEGINVCYENYAAYDGADNILYNRHPRTLLCIDHNDRPSIIIVPGRTCYSAGMTYAEMLHLPDRFKHIFNFDGGGSSVLLCGNISMCPSWRYTQPDWRENVSVFRITPNEEGDE